LTLLIVMLAFGVFSSIFASQKNRNTVGWFFLGALLGPFGLLVLAMPKLEKNVESQRKSQSSSREILRFKKESEKDFDLFRQQLKDEYVPGGFTTVDIDRDDKYMIRSKDKYIILKQDDDSISIELSKVNNFDLPVIAERRERQEAVETENDAIKSADLLVKLGEMHKAGLLTDEEFAIKKRKLI